MSKLSKVEKCIQKGKENDLIKLTQDKDMEVRLAAIAGLGKLPDNDNVCNTLIGMMNDHSPEVRAACATALGGALWQPGSGRFWLSLAAGGALTALSGVIWLLWRRRRRA